MTTTSGFYVAEIDIFRGFVDPLGEADLVCLAAPSLALCQIETGVATTVTLNVSDSGYRTHASDPKGVVAYPPLIASAFQLDTAVNLDPTQSAIAASWGSLTLNNLDDALDQYLTTWQTDGQTVRIYLGEKTYDAARGVWLDPAYATLTQIFCGVLGPWQPDIHTVSLALRDVSYYLERQMQRSFFGGTGGLDGTTDMTGVAKPIAVGGSNTHPILNVTPLPLDSANLIYELSEAGLQNPYGFSYIAVTAFDGGAALTTTATVTLIESTMPAAGAAITDVLGHLRLGSTPAFQLTADIRAYDGVIFVVIAGIPFLNDIIPPTDVASVALRALQSPTLLAVPVGYIGGYGGMQIETYGVDPAATAAAMALLVGVFVASGEAMDGVGFMHRMLAGTGAILAPGRDGKLRLLVLAAIPNGTASVLTFDDTNTADIKRVALPATIDPAPFRIRLGYGRNWTVQSGNLAGAITPSRQAFVATAVRVATGASPIDALTSTDRPTDPPIIGADGASVETTLGATQTVVNNMAALWGVPRRLYEVTVPANVGLALDWASVVTLVADFDVLSAPGKQGQIVGWRYNSADATTMFRVLV